MYILALILFAGAVSLVHAQDIITKNDNNGTEIRAKVLEVGVDNVKYKVYGNESGPTHILPKSEIFRIVYEGKGIDVFTEPAEATPTPPKEEEATYRKRGYIGMTFGPSYLTNLEGYTDAGISVNIVNFGYLFTRHIGVASSIFATDYTVNNGTIIGAVAFMIGPLFSFSATPAQKLEFDIRPSIGGALRADEDVDAEGSGFAFGMGGSIRWNCLRRFSLSLNLDYLNMELKNDDYDIDRSSVGIALGVQVRL